LTAQVLHSTDMKGCIFDIQRFSIHDGPGIRTIIFLKGCPLNCRWCCNPESINPQPELLINPELCIGCGKCIEVCTTGATSETGFDRMLCTGCGICAETCYAEARYIKGRYMTPQEVIDEAIKDVTFYKRTNGGVTFSGGEPMFQIDFLEEALLLCRENRLATAIETCGYASWEHFKRIAPLVDVYLFDIKNTNSDEHLKFTGARCERIMENCERLAKIAKRLIIRVPVIPDFNFDSQSLTKIVRFAEEIGVGEIHFLPYHRLAESKYSFLGREYWEPGVDRLDEGAVDNYVRKIETSIKIRIGG
jgi:glycyl-radical enzyme activating protein